MVTFYSNKDNWHLDDIQQQWLNLIEKNENLEVMYQSPEWFLHLIDTEKKEDLFLGALKNEDRVIGIVPIKVRPHFLKFDLYARVFWKFRVNTIYILGSLPLLAADNNLHDNLFLSFKKYFPGFDNIYIDSLPTQSFLWNYIQNSRIMKDHFLIYCPDGIRTYHSLKLHHSYEEYLQILSSKRRGDLKRTTKIFSENAGGKIEFQRFESEEKIKEFISGAVTISANSWQNKRIGERIKNSEKQIEIFRNSAKRGLFRSYILYFKQEPCAFMLGHQYRTIYYADEMAYDQRYKKYAPGRILMQQIIKDLTEDDSSQMINFSIGDSFFKKDVCNIHGEDVSIFIFKKSLTNKVLIGSHKLFKLGIHLIKKIQKMIN